MAERDAEARASEPGGAPESPGDSTSRAEQSDLLAQLETARAEAEQYKNLLQRVQADFVNYKRRVDAEQENRAEAIRAETIRAFLPLVDDFQRALAHLPSEVSKEGWAQGFALIDRNLAAAFERLGLQRLGSEGEEFNPNLHEAVAYEEHPTCPEGHIGTLVRPGYQLGDRVIRPAQVTVARAASADDQATEPGWPKHQARRAHGNGGVDQGDLQKPRNIERA
jgi:molecular chaperone GrpE